MDFVNQEIVMFCNASLQAETVVDTDYSPGKVEIDSNTENTDVERSRVWSNFSPEYDGEATDDTVIYRAKLSLRAE